MTHPFSFIATHPGLSPPRPANAAKAAVEWERWQETVGLAAQFGNDGETGTNDVRVWLEAIFGNSPYLTGLTVRELDTSITVFQLGPTSSLAELMAGLNQEDAQQNRSIIASILRKAKRRAALIIGMADIGGIWPLEIVTRALSDFAAAALSFALKHLLFEAVAAKNLALPYPDHPEKDSGFVILGLGKLGAYELNYSSDIDLIILFDEQKIHYTGRDSLQTLMTRLSRNLVKLLEERTADGYVFRTDLRLRPDPGSTPPAISVIAAETYYTSVGQNWERAALIKARAVAGDLAAGARFLDSLIPFLWRKHLDFAAIRDIHAIKRQIDARQGSVTGSLGGHNVKLGYGGIREIEFFVQTQQLIWGGRILALRTHETVETLYALYDTGRIGRDVADEMAFAYRFLRQVEHRLQMVEDNQTHSLPEDREGLNRIGIFMGYEDGDRFVSALRQQLDCVRRHFRELFRDAPTLSYGGNLVFAGAENDPETVATIGRMGFKAPGKIIEAIRGWHHGRIRATRSERARELLTDLAPIFLRVLGKTADPDLAFTRLDEFLSRIPAGVQLFSLFQRHPELLDLVAQIMGESPLLATQLARRPLLLDAVISGDFFTRLPDSEDQILSQWAQELAALLGRARDYEDSLNLTRRWGSDWRFQTGVQLMQGRIGGERAGRDFSLVAEAVIAALLPKVEADFALSHGLVPGGRFTILALGKLGSREMNVLSDLDLIFIYDVTDDLTISDGKRPLSVSTYFARLGQRMINALSAPTSEGALYEVDMRLRPLGASGPIASSLDSFRRYHEEQAWTWEHMALTRGRVVAGDPTLRTDIASLIRDTLTKSSDADKLLTDVADMRQRVLQARPAAPKPWDSKHRRGALIDLEFLAHYLQLLHGAANPEILSWRTTLAFERLAKAGYLAPDDLATCLDGFNFWHQLQQILRVSLGKVESADVPADLLDHALARATGLPDEVSRHAKLDETASSVLALYNRLIENPAKAIADRAGA